LEDKFCALNGMLHHWLPIIQGHRSHRIIGGT